MLTRRRGMIWGGVVAVLLVALLGFFLQSRMAPILPADTLPEHATGHREFLPGPDATLSDPGHGNSQPPTIQANSEKGRFSVPIFWLGQSKPGIEVPLRRASGAEPPILKATLGEQSLTGDLPQEGDYQFDFSGVDIYAVDHTLRLAGGKATLIALGRLIDDRLPVAIGVRIQVLADCPQAASQDAAFQFRWSPRGKVGYRLQHRLSLTVNTPVPQLVPAQGISFQLDSKDYYVASPGSAEFQPDDQNRTLRLVLQRLVPLVVNLLQSEPGQWASRLAESASQPRLVTVDASANALADGRRLGAFGTRSKAQDRAAEDIPASGAPIDTFTLMVPPLEEDAVVHVLVRLLGGEVVASGSTSAGPYSQEIRIDATILATCSLVVRVVDENGTPQADVPVTVNVLYFASKRIHLVRHPVGRQRKTETGPDGKAHFHGLQSAPDFHANVVVGSNFPRQYPNDNPNVPLEGTGEHEFVVTLVKTDRRIVRVAIQRAEGQTGQGTVIVVEGNGAGEWHRMTVSDLLAGSSVVDIPVRSNHVKVLGQIGACIFSAARSVQDDLVTVNFDLSAATRLAGSITLESAANGDALFYPYQLDESLLWAATAATPCLPCLHLDRSRRFALSVLNLDQPEHWYVVSPTGQVRRMDSVPPQAAGPDLSLTAELLPASDLEVTLDRAKLDGADNIALLISPVYADSRQHLEAELRLGVRVALDSQGRFPRVSLPNGRYVGLLTYTDSNGATRFGLTQGQYAEFESRKGLTTKVHLPIR